jgi:hypothetical protein
VRAGDLRSVAAVFASSPEARLALLRAVWPSIVGPQLARQAELASLTGDFLRIRVADPRWRKVLPRMRREMIDKMWSAVGKLAPRQIGFLEASTTRPNSGDADLSEALRPTRAASSARAPVAPQGVVAAAESIADPLLRDEFVRAAARYLTSTRCTPHRRGV